MPTPIKTIHRAMYAPEATKKAKEVTRCAIMPRVGPKWQHLQDKCAPTQSEACEFEKMKPVDFRGAPSDPYNHRYAIPIGEAHGWKHIGGGRGRETFEFKTGCVVKFARSDRVGGKVVGATPWEGRLSQAQAKEGALVGTEQNTYEVATFNQCADNIKELMVPIIAHSPKAPYKWLVLPKASVQKSDQSGGGSWWRVANELEEELERRGASVVDVHEGNVGRLEGDPVLVDYGFRTRCPVLKSGDKQVAKQLDQFFGKPQDVPAAQQEAAPEILKQKCRKHADCSKGMICVKPKFVDNPRYCKKIEGD